MRNINVRKNEKEKWLKKLVDRICPFLRGTKYVKYVFNLFCIPEL